MPNPLPGQGKTPRRGRWRTAMCQAPPRAPLLLPIMALLAGLALALGVPRHAGAALDCQSPAALPPESIEAGPKHHPVGRSLPDLPSFHQPDTCDRGIWFYDGNRNRQPDADEPQLYGATKIIACASCHADSPAPKSATAESVFLRQDASSLCLVCHNL